MARKAMRLGILVSHPVQYQAPWFRALAQDLESLEVFFAHRPDAVQQGAGFGTGFQWDVDLFSGYRHRFLQNVARRAGPDHYFGCDTPEIGEIIRSGRFDAFIVSGWFLKCYWQAVRACHGTGVPVLVRGDSQLGTPRPLVRRLVKMATHRWMLRRFDGFLVVGQRNRQYLAHYGVPACRMFAAPHSVDNEWFASRAREGRPRRDAKRDCWGVHRETLVAVFVGKLVAEKRPNDILLALERLRDVHRADVATVVVGAGDLESELRAAAEKMRLPVHFAGFRNQTELPDLYAAADVLVLPSVSETWGLVVNEAMACGLPAIVSDAVGCAPDLIEEGQTGFTFPAGDVNALAERLARLARLKQAGHDFGPALAAKLRGFSVEASARGVKRAIEALASERRP